jgi:hypothetical protein
MVQRVPSFAGKSHRQSTEYDTPYKHTRHDKLRGFYSPRNAPHGGVVTTRPATQVEVGPGHEEPKSAYNERMARYFKRLGAR